MAFPLAATQASASGSKAADDALAKSVLVAVKDDRNLVPDFLETLPDPVAKDVSSLATCKPKDFMRRAKGKYLVIWKCKAVERGLVLEVKDGKLLSLEVVSIEIRAVPVR